MRTPHGDQLMALTSSLAEELPRAGSRLTDAGAEQLRRKGHDILALSGHPQVRLPEHVTEAAQRAARENAAAPSSGLPELRHAALDRIATDHGTHLDPDQNILVTAGAMQGLSLVFRALLNEGDEVVIPSPCFFFGGLIQLARGRPKYVPMAQKNGYRWDLARLERAIGPRTKIIVVNSPANPTGYVLSADECRALADIAVRHDLFLVSDEAYERFVYDGHMFTSMLALRDVLGDRLVVIKSTSKTYAMANWRVGFVLGSAELVQLLTKLLEWEQLTSNAVCQQAAAAAISGPQDWMEEVVRQFERRRNRLWEVLRGLPALRTYLPMGGSFFLVDTSGIGSSAEAVAQSWIHENGIPSTPGSAFNVPGHLRLAFGMPDDTVLEELSTRLRRAVGRPGGSEPRGEEVGIEG